MTHYDNGNEKKVTNMEAANGEIVFKLEKDPEESESSPLNPPETKAKEIKKDEAKRKLTIKERLKLIKDNITVEPILACYIIPSILASLSVTNLNLEKACRVNLNYTDEICTALKLRQTENLTHYESEVQKLTASMQAIKNIIQTSIPALLILFVGAWSDKTGKRKACILLPIFGELLACLGFMVNKYFFFELPVEAVALTESIFPAITGGWYTNFIGVFSYIGDITTKEDRTYRMGLVNICMSLGYPIGSALSGVLLSWIGYYGVFACSASLYIFSLTYGYFYLPEPVRIREKDEPEKIPYKSSKGFLREFFDIRLVKQTFEVAFEKGPGNRRLRVSLLIFCVCVIFGPLQGEWAIMYLFTRYRFNWDEIQFSMWSTYSVITNLLGTMFSVSLFSKHLQLDDTLIGIISSMSKIIASFAYAFARNDLEIYLAPLLEIFNGTSFIAMRSIASKLVSGDNLGKVNSLFGLAEAVMPIIYGPLYSRVYMATLDFLPGFVFIVGALLTSPAIGVFVWLYFQHKKDFRNEEKAKSDEEKVTI